MNFRPSSRRDDPEINFIPLIDVLLVILIFLMVSTTFSRHSELQVDLPAANNRVAADRPQQVMVGITAQGGYTIDTHQADWRDAASFGEALRQAAADRDTPVIVIFADASASHQSVVNVLEAARLAGLPKVTFAAQAGSTAQR